MATPPPLPSPVLHRIFYGKSPGGIRLSSPKLLGELIADAHLQAEQWINSRNDIEIASITSGSASLGETVNAVFVTVWYRARR